jgi:hypothetical protein
MGSVNEPVGITGQVFAVAEVVERNFGAGDKIHGSKCPWWRKQTSRSCTCGRLLIGGPYENSVSDSGDRHYAQCVARNLTAVPASLTVEFFDTMTVATAVTTAFGSKTADCGDITTVPSGGTQGITNYGAGGGARYPTVSDPDTNNPGTVGVDIVTWKATYTTSNGNGTIVGVAIHKSGATLGGVSTDPVLMSVDLSPTVVKSAGMNLSWYVNHNFLGA